MAKKKVKLTANQIAYNKQISRIRRAYKTLEKQGYRFDKSVESFLPDKRPSRITQAAIERLKEITPKRLRKSTTALDESGKVVSGTEAYKERQRAVAKRAAETRAYNKWLQTPAGQAYLKQQADERWREQRRRQDMEQQRQARALNEAQIILDNVQALINRYETIGANYLNRALQREIAQFGLDAVMQAIANSPVDIVEAAQNIIFYQENMTGEEASRAIRNFINVIRGTVPTEEQQRELGALPYAST